MSTKRERDEIKLEKAHLKEHKEIADKIKHIENAVGILTERLDEITQGEECRPKSDIKFDVIVKSKKAESRAGQSTYHTHIHADFFQRYLLLLVLFIIVTYYPKSSPAFHK